MATHSVQVWRATLDNVAAWTAAEFLLSGLTGYQGPLDNGGFADRKQVYHFLVAWRLATPALRSIKGPAPITEPRPTPQQWRNMLGKLSAAAAAELIVENYLSDPACGFTDAVAILADVLTAWGDVQLSQHNSHSVEGLNVAKTLVTQ